MRADLRFTSIPGMARSGADRFGAATAVLDGAVRLSFADVARLMRRVAAALIAGGLRPGDRVALWAPNCALWIPVALGVQAAGGWLVPLNSRYKGDEAAYVVDTADARTVFVVDEFLGADFAAMLRAARPAARPRLVTLPGPGRDTGAGWEAFLCEGDAVSDAEVDARIDALTADTVSDIIFTSGTTGRPKGVLLMHGPSLRCYESLNTAYGVAEGDRHLIVTPFFHCFGYKAGWMLNLMVGACTIPVAVFDAGRCLDLIERHRVTHMPGSPTMFWSLINHPDRTARDLSSLHTVLLAAASIPVELVEAVRRELAVRTTMTGYGLTESHALGTFTRPGDPPEVVASTVGRIAPDLEIRAVDDAGEAVPAGVAGELELRGYCHMRGYFEDAEATAAAFHDGWLRTGDVGVIDTQGNVRITDRKKDIYIMGGFNVAPAEVEAVLIGMDGVAEVAVVGVPDERFGEVGAAFVVPKPGAAVGPDQVVAYAGERLANYKVPRRVEIVDELPHNATGKVLKQPLRARLATLREGVS